MTTSDQIIPGQDIPIPSEEATAQETGICSCCGTTHPLSELTTVDNQSFCADCVDRESVVCAHCGCRVLYDENAGSGELPLCGRCYDDYYTSCERCGAIIHRDDACYDDEYSSDAYCSRCYQSRNSDKPIKDYYYKPEPIFYGDGPRYLGVELEVDCAGHSDDNAESVMDIANRDEPYIYCKHDGSLEDGFEIVTHPLSLDHHMNDMPWSDILDKLRSMGYLSHKAGTCGLHVHVNRSSLGNTKTEQEEVIGRILFFFEKHWDELLKFSRRTQRQLDQWAARYGYKDHPKEMLEHAKKGTHCGRYYCVNLQNYYTIEFRMFRGTLKLGTLLATLQLVDRVCDVAVSMSDDEIRQMSWTTFVSGCTRPELIQYLKERRIYVNEPFTGEEEI